MSLNQALEELAAFAGMDPEEQELAERVCALPSVIVVSLSVTSEEINTAQALDSIGVASYVIEPRLYPVGCDGEYVLELQRFFPAPDVFSAGTPRTRAAAVKNRPADEYKIPVPDKVLLCLLLAEKENRVVPATALRKLSGDSNRFSEAKSSHWAAGLLGSTTAADKAGRTKTYMHLTDSGREEAKAAEERAAACNVTYQDVVRHLDAGAEELDDADTE